MLASNSPHQPFPARTPAELRAAIEAFDPLPARGVPFTDVIKEAGETVVASGARVVDPRCAAHLHAPTLMSSAATELAIGVTNQSMDSFDQAPAATYAEDHLVRTIAGVLGLPEQASGVITSGGTASNLLGLLLARDRAAGGANVTGLPPAAAGWRVLASQAAHTSVRQACAVLGLGRDAVVPVDTDGSGRIRLEALDETLRAAERHGHQPIAIVGTAGTTDTGAIDPLDALAQRAAQCGAWFHVDAAVGAGLALSHRLAPMLRGIEKADSVTADLHKLWWQPIGASMLLVRDAGSTHGLREPADYLNRAEDNDVLNLVDRSLDTSRRFDALKMLVSLRATGRDRLAGFVEHLVDLAAEAGRLIHAHPELELVVPPQSITVLFRCHPAVTTTDDDLDALNTDVQRTLLGEGRAVVGRTRLRGRVALKLTLVNPTATAEDIAELLDLISATGRRRTANCPSPRPRPGPHSSSPPEPDPPSRVDHHQKTPFGPVERSYRP
nr:aspartate aminotransferase family protein [Phytoactinopolyspora mesophila]